MKKKVQIGLLIASALFFLYLFVRSIIGLSAILKNADDGLHLLPLIWCVVYLVLLLCHFGVYVMIMDKKPRNAVITDEEEWWKRWDRV